VEWVCVCTFVVFDKVPAAVKRDNAFSLSPCSHYSLLPTHSWWSGPRHRHLAVHHWKILFW